MATVALSDLYLPFVFLRKHKRCSGLTISKARSVNKLQFSGEFDDGLFLPKLIISAKEGKRGKDYFGKCY